MDRAEWTELWVSVNLAPHQPPARRLISCPLTLAAKSCPVTRSVLIIASRGVSAGRFFYLSLLDWTGRQLRAVSRGTIPAQLAPILERLGVNGDGWVETVRHFGRSKHPARWIVNSSAFVVNRCPRIVGVCEPRIVGVCEPSVIEGRSRNG